MTAELHGRRAEKEALMCFTTRKRERARQETPAGQPCFAREEVELEAVRETARTVSKAGGVDARSETSSSGAPKAGHGNRRTVQVHVKHRTGGCMAFWEVVCVVVGMLGQGARGRNPSEFPGVDWIWSGRRSNGCLGYMAEGTNG